jgi:hypothetical protein
VTEQLQKVYEITPLSSYSLKDRMLIHLADWVFFFLVRLIGLTIRYKTEGWEHLEAIKPQESCRSTHSGMTASLPGRIFFVTGA